MGSIDSALTSERLCDWHVSQLSSLHFQAYKIAFDAAKKTEHAYRHELGLEDSNFVQFGHWDSLKKGLLAGDRLLGDLRHMEAAYLDNNRREHELTKHLSLASLDPEALLTLKATGQCEFEIPEWVYNLDHPSHYMRRFKSISISIPCVVGEYASVNCTFTQLSSRVRKDTDATEYGDDQHFHENFSAVQSIATSSGRDDSGLFELNFRDDRYLPFEGTGAISRCRVRLSQKENQWDVQTVSDFIVHIRYTARDGGEGLRAAAEASIPKEGVRVFNARSEFATEWYRFKNPDAGQVNELTLPLGKQHFPFRIRNSDVSISSIELVGLVDDEAPSSIQMKCQPGEFTEGLFAGVWKRPGRLAHAGESVRQGSGADRWYPAVRPGREDPGQSRQDRWRCREDRGLSGDSPL